MRMKLAPSILAADFGRLGDQVRQVEEAGVDQIHVDVMDGHFVPNLSMGPLVVRALKRVTRLPLDVHLMISDPGRYVPAFVEAGADHVSFHIETPSPASRRGADSVEEPGSQLARHQEILDWLASQDVGRGIALNPDTPAESVRELLPRVEMVLVMTVHPGFGGQRFLEENLDKVRALRALREDVDIEVDGGVDADNIVACRDAGANVFVAGSSIYGEEDPGEAALRLRELVS